MKEILCIVLLISPLLIKAQDTCLPDYGFAVKKIGINDHPVAYIEQGMGNTVLLVHGLGGNISHWSKNITTLSKSYHVIALDLPGYGHSSKNIDTVKTDLLSLYADIILGFIERKMLRNVTLIGHSMGGQIAIITALKDSQHIRQLVLVSTAGFEAFTQQEAELLILNTPASVFQNQGESAIRASFKRNFYRHPPEKLVQERLKFKFCNDFPKYAIAISSGVRGMLVHPVKNELKNINERVLIIFGQQDALIPNKFLHPSLTLDDVVRIGSGNIPGSQFLFIENAGHIVQYEQAVEFNNAVLKFLNNCDQIK
jgi:pimeloyl-ACP methyl ester carboxylesterase